MTKPVTVTNTFAAQTGPIPLSQLDSNYTTITAALNDYNTYGSYLLDTGVVNALVVTYPAGMSGNLTAGLPIQVLVAVTNTGASTINPNGIGVTSIVNPDGTALSSGTLIANRVVVIQFNGTAFQIVSGNNRVRLGAGSISTNVSVSVDDSALQSNTTGSQNTAVGYQSAQVNTTGSQNTSVGNGSLSRNTTGNHNTAVGFQGLFNVTTGIYNSSVGAQSLNAGTSGNYNCAYGAQSLGNVSTGSGNIGIGFMDSAGSYLPVFDPATENNRLCMGHASITNAYVKVAWTVTSDERDKTDFSTVPHGLSFIERLNPISYRFRLSRDDDTPSGGVRYGFKAQDILAVEGSNPVIIDNEDQDHLKYNGDSIVPVLVNAIKELSIMVKELRSEIDVLRGVV